MDVPSVTNGVTSALQVASVNALLSIDNAVVIAAATARLPPTASRRAVIIGVSAAIGLRVALGAAALPFVEVPFVRSVAATILLVVAVRLLLIRELPKERADDDLGAISAASNLPRPHLSRTIYLIFVADLAMSFDNVAIVASIADGNVTVLFLGLIACIPILVFAVAKISEIVQASGRYIYLASLYLGWLAGTLMLADPGVRPLLSSNSAFLTFTIPIACAAWVAWQSEIMRSPNPDNGVAL